MTEVKTQVKALLDAGWEVCTADEVRLEHEAETRRMQPPKGQRTRPSVDRQRTSQSFSGALPRPAEQSRRTRSSRTGTPGRRPSHRTCSNAKPRRQDRGRPGQRPPPPRQSTDRPLRARPAAGAHHADSSAAVRARPQPRRARPEHGQEQHHHHPARDPRRNPRRIRPTRHRPNIRPRLRTPPTPRNQKRFCFMTAIILPHDHFAHCPKNTKHSTVLLQGRTSPRAPTCPAGAPPSSRHRRPGHRPTRLATTGARRTSSHRTGV